MMQKRLVILFVVAALLCASFSTAVCVGKPPFKLGSELLQSKYAYLIQGKKVGLITNQSGVNSRGESTIDLLFKDPTCRLVALYAPEHGIDGKAKAGEYVESYVHEKMGIPVYSLYGKTRLPTAEMLEGVDLLIFDIQDIGARTYTYMSTLNYSMVAAQKYKKPIVVLDRPNPLGGLIVEGPVLEDPLITFVGVDNLPMAHGMTAGELARFFNRKIGADLTVIPMEGYQRSMIYSDTGLKWVQTSPSIPDLDAVFGYMATGLGEGTGIFQADNFKWIGGKGIDAQKYAELLNGAALPGVTFLPEKRGEAGGVRLKITDYGTFNPARTGICALAYGYSLGNFKVPKSGQTIVMFDKVMGTDKIGQYLEQGLTPQQIEARYDPALSRFKEERKKYLLSQYDFKPGEITVVVDGKAISFDSDSYIDLNNRVMVPLRAIAEALGAEVVWSSSAREVTITGEGQTVLLRIGSPVVVVNGAREKVDTTPVIKNSRTMVPVRFVAQFLGADVHWNNRLKTVTINP